MGLKTKWNRFWTLRNTEGGFTLVELVVVIAILAILAGIAVPTYSGYIKKAREATDMQLIAAVNTAFGAACLEQGIQTSDVETAAISVTEQKVFGISSVTPTTEEQLNSITLSFNSLFAGNQSTPFLTENVLSLRWVPEDNSFVMDHETSVDSRIVLSNGRNVVIPPEVMADIQASTYADMGYTEVAATINNLSRSSTTLAQVAGGLGMMDRFTAVMLSNHLISDDKAEELEDNLAITNVLNSSYGVAANEAANGLQMVTARYLAGASDEDIAYLLNDITLTDSTSMLRNMSGDAGGTRTVAAAALQYALVEAYAASEAAKGENGATITYTERVWDQSQNWGLGGFKNVDTTVSISEYLRSDAAADDPIAALAAVQGTTGYSNYTTTEQYTSDINGFVGTMGLLGNNVGSVDANGNITTEGAINPGDYLSQGINGQEAADILTSVLGS